MPAANALQTPQCMQPEQPRDQKQVGRRQHAPSRLTSSPGPFARATTRPPPTPDLTSPIPETKTRSCKKRSLTIDRASGEGSPSKRRRTDDDGGSRPDPIEILNGSVPSSTATHPDAERPRGSDHARHNIWVGSSNQASQRRKLTAAQGNTSRRSYGY